MESVGSVAPHPDLFIARAVARSALTAQLIDCAYGWVLVYEPALCLSNETIPVLVEPNPIPTVFSSIEGYLQTLRTAFPFK